jgi:hypothetical protein
MRSKISRGFEIATKSMSMPSILTSPVRSASVRS